MTITRRLHHWHFVVTYTIICMHHFMHMTAMILQQHKLASHSKEATHAQSQRNDGDDAPALWSAHHQGKSDYTIKIVH